MNFHAELLRASECYEVLLAGGSGRCCLQDSQERGEEGEEKVGELGLQARFYAGEFGDRWETVCGREVQLLDPGVWNREAGPDFRNARVLVDGEEKVSGDLEMDLRSVGWEQHGHATNPDFENVVLHFFFHEGQRRSFARTVSHRSVMQVRLSLERDAVASGRALFVSEPIREVEEALRLIALAARHRVLVKAKSAAVGERLHGRKAVVFQGVARALGYRENTIPLTLLAQRCGWKRVSQEGGESLLFGLAGFLGSQRFDEAPEETRRYLRELWEGWWQIREAEERLVLPEAAWRLAGVRPANHPHRRVGALAALAAETPRLGNAVEGENLGGFMNCLSGMKHSFWGSHWNLRGAQLPKGKELALVGKNRANDIAVNLFVPMVAAEGKDGFAIWEKMRVGQTPTRVADYAAWLCPNLPERLLATAAVQQGLLQLGGDFRGKESPHDLYLRYLKL